MTYKDWDDRERWEDDSKCLVCKGDLGKSQVTLCSATCVDIWQWRETFLTLEEQLGYGEENDCHA